MEISLTEPFHAKVSRLEVLAGHSRCLFTPTAISVPGRQVPPVAVAAAGVAHSVADGLICVEQV